MASGTTDCSSKADSAVSRLSHCQRALMHSSRISRRYYSTSCMSFSTSQPAQIKNVSGCKDQVVLSGYEGKVAIQVGQFKQRITKNENLVLQEKTAHLVQNYQ